MRFLEEFNLRRQLPKHTFIVVDPELLLVCRFEHGCSPAPELDVTEVCNEITVLSAGVEDQRLEDIVVCRLVAPRKDAECSLLQIVLLDPPHSHVRISAHVSRPWDDSQEHTISNSTRSYLNPSMAVMGSFMILPVSGHEKSVA